MRSILLTLLGVVGIVVLMPNAAQATPSNCSSLEIVAHRGYHPARVDENSMPAFQAAADRGYSIETDVWPDADGQLWIFHDRDTFRATGVHGNIDQMTTQQVSQLRYLKAGSPLPTLQQAAALFAQYPSLRVYVEVKVQNTAGAVTQALRDAGRVQNTYITSFTGYVHHVAPDFGLLLKDYTSTPDPTTLPPQGISIVAFQPSQITTSTVDSYHASGLQVQDRDANATSEWRQVIKAGADGILTDFPDDLKAFCPHALTPPSLSSFTPTSGGPGMSVTITGSGFTDATSVKFGSAPAASFTVNTDSQITAVVPSNAPAQSKIGVTTPNGVALSNQPFKQLPTISSFTPSSAPAGASITISGTNFITVKSVKFGGVTATFTTDSPDQITATVPTGVKPNAKVLVTTPAGNAQSATPFQPGTSG